MATEWTPIFEKVLVISWKILLKEFYLYQKISCNCKTILSLYLTFLDLCCIRQARTAESHMWLVVRFGCQELFLRFFGGITACFVFLLSGSLIHVERKIMKLIFCSHLLPLSSTNGIFFLAIWNLSELSCSLWVKNKETKKSMSQFYFGVHYLISIHVFGPTKIFINGHYTHLVGHKMAQVSMFVKFFK